MADLTYKVIILAHPADHTINHVDKFSHSGSPLRVLVLSQLQNLSGHTLLPGCHLTSFPYLLRLPSELLCLTRNEQPGDRRSELRYIDFGCDALVAVDPYTNVLREPPYRTGRTIALG
jgi:hypothetical protein